MSQFDFAYKVRLELEANRCAVNEFQKREELELIEYTKARNGQRKYTIEKTMNRYCIITYVNVDFRSNNARIDDPINSGPKVASDKKKKETTKYK